jgi:hypothetical protein
MNDVYSGKLSGIKSLEGKEISISVLEDILCTPIHRE